MKRTRFLRARAVLVLSIVILLGLAGCVAPTNNDAPSSDSKPPVSQDKENASSEPTSSAEAVQEEAAYEKICDGGYKIEGSGYLFVGTEKAALFDGSMYSTASAATAERLSGDREIINVSTAVQSEAAIDLGGLTFQPITVSGTLSGTAYLSEGQGILVSGDILGSGTAMLNKQVLFPEAHLYYENYCAYLDGLDQINAKVGNIAKLTVCTTGAILDRQYFDDLYTLVTKFVKAEDTTSFVLNATTTDGRVPDFTTKWGSASMSVHMPMSGLYGYDFGGTTICTSDDQYRFFVCNYGNIMSIRDSDIQSCYIMMNDTQAIVVDVGMYNGPLFFETLCNVIGDRDLYVYITHAHGDHWANLEDFDANRIKTIFWPEGEVSYTLNNYNLLEDKRLTDKITYVKDGDEFSVAGRDYVVCNMSSHTEHGTALVNKTDRILFAGDTLGTLQYVGGTSTGRHTAEEYLADLNRLTDVYGKYFDNIYQAHSVLATPEIINTLKMLVNAFIENGPDILINGAVVSYMDHVLTPEEYNAIMETGGLFDAQIVYSERLGIDSVALKAYNAQ